MSPIKTLLSCLFNARPHPESLLRGEGELLATVLMIPTQRGLDALMKTLLRSNAASAPGGESHGEVGRSFVLNHINLQLC